MNKRVIRYSLVSMVVQISSEITPWERKKLLEAFKGWVCGEKRDSTLRLAYAGKEDFRISLQLGTRKLNVFITLHPSSDPRKTITNALTETEELARKLINLGLRNTPKVVSMSIRTGNLREVLVEWIVAFTMECCLNRNICPRKTGLIDELFKLLDFVYDPWRCIYAPPKLSIDFSSPELN